MMAQQDVQSPTWIDSVEHMAVRGLVWAFIGFVYGFLFVVMTEYLRDVTTGLYPELGAAVGAAGLTALVYSSMRLAVMVANFTMIAMVVYTWGNDNLTLESLVSMGSFVGVVSGALYGLFDKKSRVFCAEAKIVAGLFSGMLVALLLYLVTLFAGDPAYPWSAVLTGTLGTLIYVYIAHWFVKRCHAWVPDVVDGGIVGLGIGSATGLVFMVMAGLFDTSVLASPEHQMLIERVGQDWVTTALACSAVSFMVGVARAVLNIRWYNL